MGENKVIVFGVDGLIPELVDKFAEEGVLPHINDMMLKGSTTKLLPYISAWGDLNWVSFLSGQAPGESWIGQRIASYNDDNLLGLMGREKKKCALVHFPESLSEQGTSHFNFAPFYSGKGNPPFEMASAVIYSTHIEDQPQKSKKEFLGWPREGTLAHHLKGNYRAIKQDKESYTFQILMNDGSELPIVIYPLDNQQIRLQYPGGNTVIEKGCWSQWVNMGTGNKNGFVNFKLLNYEPEKNKIELLQSQMNEMNSLSNDPGLEKRLLEACGPFISKWTVQVTPEEAYYTAGLEEAHYQGNWLADAAVHLLNKEGFDLFATVFRLNDETHHNCLGKTDPSSPFYEIEDVEKYEQVIREGYIILDKVIGRIMEQKEDDTVLILASDHGDVPNHYMCDIYRRLEECGLCKLDKNNQIVWEETKAYLKDERGGLEIYVNLKGRDEKGIVAPSDYERVQTEIFRALTTWYYQTPSELTNVVGITVKKQDAPMIGYWGEKMGDVIFAYNNGFVWGVNTRNDVVAPVSTHGANHGPQIPTARTSYSSNYGFVSFYGSSIQKGVNEMTQNRGIKKMDDVGATIAALLGISNNQSLTGSVIKAFIVK